jgi:hypothetical protein
MRKLSLARLGHKCTNTMTGDNIVYNIRREKPTDIVKTCLFGNVILVFTSYGKPDDTTQDANYVMDFVVPMDNEVMPTSTTVATHLMVDILQGAIKWIWKSNELDDTFPSEGIKGLLEKYMNILFEKLEFLLKPADDKDQVISQVKQFILDREWPDNSGKEQVLGIIEDFLLGTTTDFGQTCYSARSFIYRNVARQTKVVGHVVDGIHRLTALEYALIGYNYNPSDEEEEKFIKKYQRTLPHAGRKVNISAILPTEQDFLDDKFLNKMRALSCSHQVSLGKMHLHGKKIFYSTMILEFGKKKFHKNYLIDGGGINVINEKDVLQAQLNQYAKAIYDLICDEGKIYIHMVPGMEIENVIAKNSEEKWKSSLFCCKKYKKDSNVTKQNITFRWDDFHFFLQSIIRCQSNIHDNTQYNLGKDFKAKLFELVQVLLWTRISEECEKQLLNFFQNSDPTMIQLSASDIGGSKENRLVTCMISTVGTSVYYSLPFFRKKKAKPDILLIPKLIQSAITGTTLFFLKMGMDPNPPQLFNDNIHIQQFLSLDLAEGEDIIYDLCDDLLSPKAQALGLDEESNLYTELVEVMVDKCKQGLTDGLGPPKDYVSFITVAFALHLQEVLVNDWTGGRSKFKEWDNLDIHGVEIIGYGEQKEIGQDGASIISWTTKVEEFERYVLPTLYKREEDVSRVLGKISFLFCQRSMK